MEQAAGPNVKVRLFKGGPTCGGRVGVVEYVMLSTFPVRGLSTEVVSPSGMLPGLYCPDVWVGIKPEFIVRSVAELGRMHPTPDGRPETIYVFCGYASWTEPQLERELGGQYWSVGT